MIASKSKTAPTIIHRILLLSPKDMADTSTTPTLLILMRNGKLQGHIHSNIVASKAQAMPSRNEDEDVAEELRGDVFESWLPFMLLDLEFHGRACDWLKNPPYQTCTGRFCTTMNP